jgi:hypothetical protein
MGRFVVAIAILILALLGLTMLRSGSFRNFLNQIGGSSQPQITGFNTSVPKDGTPIAPSTTGGNPGTNPSTPSGTLDTPSTTKPNQPSNRPGTTKPVIPARW